MPLRELRRRLVIAAAVRLGLDEHARASERRALERRSPHVRVLFLHGTPAMHSDRFRRQLAWLRDQFTVIDFATFQALFDGAAGLRSDRPPVMLTFDDGFLNNYTVAAPLLEEAGMRGVLFIIPASVNAPATRKRGASTGSAASGTCSRRSSNGRWCLNRSAIWLTAVIQSAITRLPRTPFRNS